MSANLIDIRDPLVERLIGPGKPFELEAEIVGSHEHEVFKGAPRNLACLYHRGIPFRERMRVVDGDTGITYAEGFARAAGLAQELQARFAVTKGTTVAVVTANRPEWTVSLLAITAPGGLAALVNSRGAAEEMLRAIDKVGCTFATVDAERDDVIAATEPNPAWPHIVIGDPKALLRANEADFAYLSAPQPGVDFAPVEIWPTDEAIILFTSGTHGFLKGALLSHGTLAHSVSAATFMGTLQDTRYEAESGETLPENRRTTATPVVILWPMLHFSGIMPILRPISVDTTIHIMGKWSADVAFDMIEHVGMTRLSFVPPCFSTCSSSPAPRPHCSPTCATWSTARRRLISSWSSKSRRACRTASLPTAMARPRRPPGPAASPATFIWNTPPPAAGLRRASGSAQNADLLAGRRRGRRNSRSGAPLPGYDRLGYLSHGAAHRAVAPFLTHARLEL